MDRQEITFKAGLLIGKAMNEGLTADETGQAAALVLAYLVSKDADVARKIYVYAQGLMKKE